MIALVLHLGGVVGECVSLIGDGLSILWNQRIHTPLWKYSQYGENIVKRENKTGKLAVRETRGPVVRQDWGEAYGPTQSHMPAWVLRLDS
jgi:hypothetical protein